MYDLTVVGAGPAGLAAAKVAAEHGLSVLVVDEQQRPGGQIFRQPPAAFRGEQATYTAGYTWGRDLVALPASHPQIDWAFGTTAFGVLHDRDAAGERRQDGDREQGADGDRFLLAVHGPRAARTVATRRLLIATGAYDLPVPIPGGTLPGVMTAGAVQGLLKSQKLLTPGPFVLAGGHPLLLVVADQLLRAGAQIAEVAFARGLPGPREAIASLGALPGHLGMLAEMGGGVRRLLAHGVRISRHTLVTATRGDGCVEQVDLARTNRDGTPGAERRTVEAATLVLGYGFLPSTELARQARCAMCWDARLGGWVVAHDESMRTSVDGIYVAGEPTGVAGAEQSRAEGTIAGQAVVEDLRGPGRISVQARIRAAAELRRATRFSSTVQRLFEPDRRALAALATPDTIVCRCELVRRRDLDHTLAVNPEMSTASAVKLECRSGMGPCQGRYCESTVATLVATARSRSPEQVGCFTAHLPVKPVPLTALAELDPASFPWAESEETVR